MLELLLYVLSPSSQPWRWNGQVLGHQRRWVLTCLHHFTTEVLTFSSPLFIPHLSLSFSSSSLLPFLLPSFLPPLFLHSLPSSLSSSLSSFLHLPHSTVFIFVSSPLSSHTFLYISLPSVSMRLLYTSSCGRFFSSLDSDFMRSETPEEQQSLKQVRTPVIYVDELVLKKKNKIG